MADFTDLQIQFRRAKKTSADGMQSTHEVLATINGSGSWRGESTIDYAQLAEAERDTRQYGKRLGEVLFNPAIMSALRQARGLRERPVRIRLWLEMGPNGEREDQHGLRWERVYIVLNGTDWPLAIAPGLPFSRYVPAESVDSDASDDSVFRLLVVFGSPDNLASEQRPIDVDADLSTLLDGIGPLMQGRRFRLAVMPGRTAISAALKARVAKSQTEIVEGPSTIDSITHAMQDCHGLHIVAHGTMNPQTQRGSLVLEDADGHCAFAFDDDLYPWIHPDLRLVVLQSCHSTAPTPKLGLPFVGVGPRLVQMGVPAVVAMQDYVAMDDACVFAKAFYRSLVRGGLVDVAVNEGRQELFQKSKNDKFSIPALFMRLKGGLLWRPDPVRDAVVAGLATPVGRSEPHRDAAIEVGIGVGAEPVTTEFDVFLCHNTQDKPQVREICSQLRSAGVRSWLDDEQLRPGLPWQTTLENQLSMIGAAAVFVGASGFGPWQSLELRAFLDEFVRRGCPVIPVLLPDAEISPQLPIFLRQMTWVDFRREPARAFERLVWGITGRKPAQGR